MHHRPPSAGLTHSQVVLAIALVGGGLVLVSSLALRRSRSEPDIAKEAKDFLRERDVKPLDANWKRASAESPIATLAHPLLGQVAPDFELNDIGRHKHTLAEHAARGPVVLVFYYGYYCNHCVAQLFALQADLAKFQERGAAVITISPDSPQETREKFAKYGAFAFPVLADPDNRTAAAYSLFRPAAGGKPERLLHGTFVIDQAGVVRWCQYGEAPFTANATLLVELEKLRISSEQTPQ